MDWSDPSNAGEVEMIEDPDHPTDFALLNFSDWVDNGRISTNIPFEFDNPVDDDADNIIHFILRAKKLDTFADKKIELEITNNDKVNNIFT